jgi:23S rRNA pseudouridine1911/1915/1917 synthase
MWPRPPGVEEGAVVSVFRVPAESAGQRVDVFLQGQLKRTSRTRTQAIVKLSAFNEAGKRLRSNDRVQAHAHVLLWRAAWDEDPVPTEIPVLFEDDHLIAVDKPANLPVHPSARYHKNTLINLMKAERPNEYLTLVHRLDRETSGVLLLAKDPDIDRRMKRQLEMRDGVEKGYVAITWGVPTWPAGPLTEEESALASYRYACTMELDPTNAYRVKMRLGDGPDSLDSATRFTVEETRSVGEKTYARVRCDLETGRQHQIRLHLTSLGSPIVGDKLYGPDESLFARGVDGELTDDDRALLELPRHALHAARLSIVHPVTGDRLTIDAPMPTELSDFWTSLTSATAT